MLDVIFHGEATIKPVAKIPEGAVKQPHNGDLIIAPSETVGHHHRIYCEEKEAALYERDGVLYLKVDSSVDLTCRDKHDAVTIEPGVYEVGKQREWNYLEQMEQYVAD